MGAERWIVFLVLVSLGGGIYIMSYLVDEESLERYGKRVADYNAQHHETMMDAALHRAKRRFPVPDDNKQPVESKDDTENEQVNDAGFVDHPFSENDRVMRARLNDDYTDSERGEWSIVGDVKPKVHEQEVLRAKRYSEQGINGQNLPRSYQETATVERSIEQGINEDAEHPYHETAGARSSSEQGKEEHSERSYNEAGRGTSSSVQGMNEELDHIYQDSAKARSSSGQGIYKELSVLDSKVERENLLNPSLNAYLLESSEDNDGREEQILLTNEIPTAEFDASWSKIGDSKPLTKLAQLSEESQDESGYSEPNESHIKTYEEFYEVDSREADHRFHLLSRHLHDSDGDKKLVTFNKGIDFILKLMNALFYMEGKDSVPLNGLNKTFGHGIMQGTFEASLGFFRNPASLHRTGDVAIVKNGDSVGLEVALGLETLEAGYDHYDLKILKIHQNGTLDVSIAENSIKMKISLTYYPQCKVDVNYLELDKLGGIKINITGLGAFQSMFDMLSKWLLDNFTNDFRNIVNKKLIEKAKKAVAREDICQYFPLNLL